MANDIINPRQAQHWITCLLPQYHSHHGVMFMYSSAYPMSHPHTDGGDSSFIVDQGCGPWCKHLVQTLLYTTFMVNKVQRRTMRKLELADQREKEDAHVQVDHA